MKSSTAKYSPSRSLMPYSDCQKLLMHPSQFNKVFISSERGAPVLRIHLINQRVLLERYLSRENEEPRIPQPHPNMPSYYNGFTSGKPGAQDLRICPIMGSFERNQEPLM